MNSVRLEIQRIIGIPLFYSSPAGSYQVADWPPDDCDIIWVKVIYE